MFLEPFEMRRIKLAKQPDSIRIVGKSKNEKHRCIIVMVQGEFASVRTVQSFGWNKSRRSFLH